METGLGQLGKYELRESLGRGGMAEVWKAFDPSLQRYVAIKLMHADLRADPEFVKRFEREARVIAALHHPHIVQLHDFQVAYAAGSSNPVAYMVMEYISGQTLADYLRATSRVGRFPSPAEIIHLFSAISSAVDYAHQRNMLHRDIKPANILLDQHRPARFPMGEAVLTDFGIARLLNNASATLTGQWIGTPLYMSPEQAQGHTCDGRSDIYSLGIILYEMLTGAQPFQGETPIAIIMQQISVMPIAPDLLNPGISPAARDVILRSLAKNPEERFPTASAMTAALMTALNVSPPPRVSSVMPPDMGALSFQETEMPRSALSEAAPFEPLKKKKQAAQSRKKLHMLMAVTALLVALAGSGLTAFYAMTHSSASTTVHSLVGHALFVSSGQVTNGDNQGIDDELQIDLHAIPDPDPGKSYYAWLLSDRGVTPQTSLFLGRLTVSAGNVHFLYPGNTQHSNLIGMSSRLLITEEESSTMPASPSSDQSTWKYYAELPQTPDTTGGHKPTIDIIRNLLYDAPGLQTDLPGGIDLHFFLNTQKVLEWSDASRDAWHHKDASTLHANILRILAYLDGLSLVGRDMPAGSPILVDSALAQVPLIDYQDNQELVSYVDRMNSDLTGLYNRRDATPAMKELAVQADEALLNNVKPWLLLVRQDARQLAYLSQAQLLLPTTLALVNDLANQASNAYNGQANLSGAQRGGALWIHDHDQQIATFDVSTY